MLMGADNGAIDEVQLPIELAGGIGLLLEHGKQALEYAGLLPAVEATGWTYTKRACLRHLRDV
jgi:hypothetical protein